jgi:hypothetical protein
MPNIPDPSRYRLIEKILALSLANSWERARAEWDLSQVYFEPLGKCVCGHIITEHCELTKRLTNHIVVVGNCCVRKFFDLRSASIFAALKRILRDPTAALSAPTIEYAYQREWITKWDRRFSLDTQRKPKRRLSPAQLTQRIRINKQVALRVSKEGHANA